MSTPRMDPLGDQAVIIECAPEDHTARRLASLLANTAGIVDLIPTSHALTVVYDPFVLDAQQIRDLIGHPPRYDTPPPSPRIHRIPVAYDGPDLAEVAQRCGLTVAEVIALHAGACHTVAMLGFLPGFPYLDGLPPALRLPRRATPRTRVDAGSVAIANEQTGIYPQPSPGGWHLIGRTAARLFDPERVPPTLFEPGDEVRFEAIA